MGRLSIARGQFRKALDTYDVRGQVAASDVEKSRQFVRLFTAGNIFGYLGQHDEGYAVCQALYHLAASFDTAMAMPDYAIGFEIVQSVKQGDKQRVDSLAKLQRARFAERDKALPHFEQGRADLFLGHLDSALGHFEMWAGDKRDFEHLYWFGQVHAEAERLRDAVKAYEDALERYDQSRWDSPIESTRIHFLLAQAYEKSGRPEKAADEYRKFLGLWKDADTAVDDIKYAKRRLTQLGA